MGFDRQAVLGVRLRQRCELAQRSRKRADEPRRVGDTPIRCREVQTPEEDRRRERDARARLQSQVATRHDRKPRQEYKQSTRCPNITQGGCYCTVDWTDPHLASKVHDTSRYASLHRTTSRRNTMRSTNKTKPHTLAGCSLRARTGNTGRRHLHYWAGATGAAHAVPRARVCRRHPPCRRRPVRPIRRHVEVDQRRPLAQTAANQR